MWMYVGKGLARRNVFVAARSWSRCDWSSLCTSQQIATSYAAGSGSDICFREFLGKRK